LNSEHPQQTNYVFVALLCICFFIFGFPVGATIFSLQDRLQPADSVLFGHTPIGGIMLAVPTVLISFVPTIAVALTFTRWIRRRLRMPDMAPVQLGAWAKSIDMRSMNWRLAGGIAAIVLILVGAKGFGSYFYVAENGVFVRPPLEFSMRHYEWKSVATVSVRCRDTTRASRFRYILEMSDGYEVHLSRARVAQFADSIEKVASRLDRLPDIRYEFDVSQDGLESFARDHGSALPNALRKQVLANGGTLQ
jgi:hypothetical protein